MRFHGPKARCRGQGATERLGDSYPERSLRGPPASSFSYLAKTHKTFYSQTHRQLPQRHKGNKENVSIPAGLLDSKHPPLKTTEGCQTQLHLQQTSQAPEPDSYKPLGEPQRAVKQENPNPTQSRPCSFNYQQRGSRPREKPYPVQSVVAVGEKNRVRHWEVHVRMDLGEIMNIQDGLLENKAGSGFNEMLTASGPPGAIRQQKLADLSLSQPQNKNE